MITKQQANLLLSEKLRELADLMSECEELADEHGLSFTSPINHYGMGGYYYGKNSSGWNSNQADYNGDNTAGYWFSSSEGC